VVPVQMPSTGGHVRDRNTPAEWATVGTRTGRLRSSSGKSESTTLCDTGLPVVIVTSPRAVSAKLRNTPMMQSEHDGQRAMVVSQGRAVAYHSDRLANLAAGTIDASGGR
jgi:hypothetical protein